MEDKDIPTEDATQSLKNELLSLAEKHEIKHTAAYIKKASHDALEKTKRKHERKQLEETNEYLSSNVGGFRAPFWGVRRAAQGCARLRRGAQGCAGWSEVE